MSNTVIVGAVKPQMEISYLARNAAKRSTVGKGVALKTKKDIDHNVRCGHYQAYAVTQGATNLRS